MTEDLVKAEKAAFRQAVTALYIPLSLFLSCVASAAGVYLIYNSYAVGWAFVTVAFTVIISAFVALIRFQNKYRAKGLVGRAEATAQDELVSAHRE
ncbi:MAG TPA: hypothetical protein V6D17_14560 [Candidatus Obscuribacterales bacterium]